MFKIGIIGTGWIADKMAETLSIMRQMDSLRKEWGVVYPMD